MWSLTINVRFVFCRETGKAAVAKSAWALGLHWRLDPDESAHNRYVEKRRSRSAGARHRNALNSLGFANVEDVRQGKLIEVQLSAASEEEARASLDAMCKQLLANMVIENYQVELIGG